MIIIKKQKSIVPFLESDSLYEIYDFETGKCDKRIISDIMIEYVADNNTEALVSVPNWTQQLKLLKKFLETADANSNNIKIVVEPNQTWNFNITNTGTIKLGLKMSIIWRNKKEYINYINDILRMAPFVKLIFDLDVEEGWAQN